MFCEYDPWVRISSEKVRKISDFGLIKSLKMSWKLNVLFILSRRKFHLVLFYWSNLTYSVTAALCKQYFCISMVAGLFLSFRNLQFYHFESFWIWCCTTVTDCLNETQNDGPEKRSCDWRMGGEWMKWCRGGGGWRWGGSEGGQRREAGDRLTSGGNPTRPSELHWSSTAKNKTREASSADKTTYTQLRHTQVVVQ